MFKLKNCTAYYNEKGELHRDGDLTAIEYSNGNKEWHQNGKLHRDNGSAIEHVNGDKWWYQHGKLHRLDGPSAEHISGTKWYYYGEHIKCSSTEEFQRTIKLRVFW